MGTVHPHLRGEYDPVRARRCAAGGSPPPAWGIHPQLGPDPDRRRFTPTCVGNTPHATASRPRESVHPHLRGEYVLDALREAWDAGSPPPAWGIRYADAVEHASQRFTPTCVGNTHSPEVSAFLQSVHPHLRGEYVARLSNSLGPVGSPPPAWGILNSQHPYLGGDGSPPPAWGIQRRQCLPRQA